MIYPGTKVCTGCGERKPLETGFHIHNMKKDGYNAKCKDCANEYAREWRSRRRAALRAVDRRRGKERTEYHREWRARQRLKKFGLTQSDHDAMLDTQRGGCAICGNPPGKTRLHIDHCHTTGRVRGLLCGKCNPGIGQFNDSPWLLRKAARYIERTLPEFDGQTSNELVP